MITLLRSMLRATRWLPLAMTMTAVLGYQLGLVWCGVTFTYVDSTMLIRLNSTVVVISAFFAFDDRAYSWAKVLPLYRLACLARVASVCAVVALAWFVQLLIVPHLVVSSASLTWTWLTIEPLALLVVSWAVASLVARERWQDRGELSATGVYVAGALAIVIAFLPPQLGLYVSPADEDFSASRTRWVALVAVAVLVKGIGPAGRIVGRVANRR